MVLGPRLDLRQTQSLVMTPQLQQAIKLLALSNLEIEAFIGEALDANPLLDLGAGAEAPAAEPEETRRTTLESSPIDQLIGEGRADNDRPLDIDPATLDRDRDTGDFEPGRDLERGGDFEPGGDFEFGGDSRGSGAGPGGNDGPAIDERGAASETLAEHLHAQIGPAAPAAATAFIAHALVDHLDDAGYLPLPLNEVAEGLGIELAEAEAGLAVIQSLDPTGVGARSLAECLALQAREADRHDPCMARLIDNLDLLARGELARLKRMCGVDDEDFADMLTELRGYDPKPGLKYSSGGGEPVVPDILIRAKTDAKGNIQGWDIALNQATLPRLVVNRSYYIELRGACADKSSKGWLSEKLADANWLVKALDQRQKTILKVAAEIVQQQDGFFRHGVSHLKPLTLKTVAEAISMHESTVSRVTSNKYLNCDRGTFELKYFFTSGVASADGESAVSAQAVKASIRQLIDAEDPKAILSDDALVDLLNAKGFDLARRTVAKYREAIGIGSSVQRRRQKTLAGIG
ncbi:MAG: RNA polymerase factor sigma-54 [Alphaproteobacteria bacterium]|nr:RNA polymerase factor sigma-54 [Alphaproteobacteria bacterium]